MIRFLRRIYASDSHTVYEPSRQRGTGDAGFTHHYRGLRVQHWGRSSYRPWCCTHQPLCMGDGLANKGRVETSTGRLTFNYSSSMAAYSCGHRSGRCFKKKNRVETVRASGVRGKPPGKTGDPGRPTGGDVSPPRKRQGKLRDQKSSGHGGPGFSLFWEKGGRATNGPRRPPLRGRPSRACRGASR